MVVEAALGRSRGGQLVARRDVRTAEVDDRRAGIAGATEDLVAQRVHRARSVGAERRVIGGEGGRERAALAVREEAAGEPAIRVLKKVSTACTMEAAVRVRQVPETSCFRSSLFET